MRRLLGFFVLAAIVAFGAVWLANINGHLDFELGSWQIRMSAGLAFALAALFALAAIVLARLLGLVLGAPGAAGQWWRLRRQRRGEDALSRGLLAAAAGDVAEVRRLTKRASRSLSASPLGLLFTAQAAALDGDGEGQRTAYRAMLAHPHTEFVGLRGLFMEAMARHDSATAIELAARAHVLKPRAAWPANALFDLKSARGEWADATSVLEATAKAKLIAPDIAKRRRAVLLTARAIEAETQDPSQALSLALAALDLSPGLSPAAALAARRLAYEGKAWRAQDIVEAAWTQSPHPDLAAAYAAIKPRETAPERSERLLKLARLNREHFESRMLEAEQHMTMNRWSEARRVLAPLARGFASARVCTLMAEIEESQRHDAAAAHAWLGRAVRAPRDAEWRCSVCGWASPAWHAICGQCGGFDTLSWTAPQTLQVEPYAPGYPGAAGGEEEGLVLEANAAPPRQAPGIGPAPLLAPQAPAEPHDRAFFVPPRAPDDPGPDGESFEPVPEREPGPEPSS